MEDNSLDDFFAKKDKTKKKSKSKLTPSDFLAQQEAGIKKSKKKQDKENEAQSEERKTTNVILAQKDDEEWVDFEAETETDYSGLRIQNLQISNKEEEGEVEENENENEEDGETKEKREAASGPWHGSQQSSHPVQVASTAMPEPPPPEPEPSKDDKPKLGKYVPPGARSGGQSATGTPTRPTPRRKKTAPNLHSEDDFPTLGGGNAPEINSWGSSGGSRGDFEKVQSGGRNIDDSNKVNQQLSLGNRYSSLQD
ncbi:Hypothetical predicted protein [Mytilus galloprovincialis]|uniref:CDV3-like protein n=1 Tax=Mytilus galloprovincialis TaxID=29158 RepID=A0A8B6FRT1_MYTGA|nr:Hypothetical predicted protein [Mytilus galloprovincialis]